MLTEVTGLILRSVNIGESDRLITVFTKEMGNVTAMVKGARSLRNKNMPSTQQYCYSSIILYKKGDKLWVRESNLIEGFFGIRESLDRLGLAGLNCLYAISSGKYPLEKIKAAFEIRALSIIGFMPEVLSCRDCHKSSSDFFFDIMGGNIQCRACRDDYILKNPIIDPASTESRIVTLLSEGARTALAYLVHCPQERLFSFSVSDEDMKLVSNACEEYLVNQLERSFKSLDFYKEVRH